MRMPRLLVICLSLGLALSASAAPRESRRLVSANGVYRFQFVEAEPGKCRVEVVTDRGPAWTLEQCVGDVHDAFFMASDGQRFWVVKTLPLAVAGKPVYRGQGRARRLVAPGWSHTVVAVQYDRTGKVLEQRRLRDLLTGGGYSKVRPLASRFTWLQGVNGVPGKGPRLTPEGQVELETVEGRTLVLPLDAGKQAQEGTAKAAPR